MLQFSIFFEISNFVLYYLKCFLILSWNFYFEIKLGLCYFMFFILKTLKCEIWSFWIALLICVVQSAKLKTLLMSAVFRLPAFQFLLFSLNTQFLPSKKDRKWNFRTFLFFLNKFNFFEKNWFKKFFLNTFFLAFANLEKRRI